MDEANDLECSDNETEEGEVVEDWVVLDECADQLSHHIKISIL